MCVSLTLVIRSSIGGQWSLSPMLGGGGCNQLLLAQGKLHFSFSEVGIIVVDLHTHS